MLRLVVVLPTSAERVPSVIGVQDGVYSHPMRRIICTLSSGGTMGALPA
jgi:hypothetical protein